MEENNNLDIVEAEISTPNSIDVVHVEKNNKDIIIRPDIRED